MNTKKLREQIIHELGLCVYGCNGIHHITAMDDDEVAEIDKVMKIIEKWHNEQLKGSK